MNDTRRIRQALGQTLGQDLGAKLGPLDASVVRRSTNGSRRRHLRPSRCRFEMASSSVATTRREETLALRPVGPTSPWGCSRWRATPSSGCRWNLIDGSRL